MQRPVPLPFCLFYGFGLLPKASTQLQYRIAHRFVLHRLKFSDNCSVSQLDFQDTTYYGYVAFWTLVRYIQRMHTNLLVALYTWYVHIRTHCQQARWAPTALFMGSTWDLSPQNPSLFRGGIIVP